MKVLHYFHRLRQGLFVATGDALAVGIILAIHVSTSQATPTDPDLRRDATVLAVEKALPCVVNIATETIIEYQDFYQRLFSEFFGQGRVAPRQERQQSIGSGVIIDEEGYVLTNLHVVRRANRTQVKLWDGREYDAVPIVATPFSDVALLKIQARPGEKFKAIKFAADDELLLGETVLALGNPFGLGGAVTKGILSSKSRRPPSGNEPLNIQDWLQTDAAINPGNSGGPLINLRGDLIGLNVAVYGEGQGIGFAIPIKQVSDALAQFFSPEVAHGLWFGAHVKPGPAPLKVTAVQPGGPAAQAGLRVGDTIVRLNGKSPDGLIEFNDLIGHAPEHKLSLVIERQRDPLVVELVPFEDLIRQRTGLTLSVLTKEEATRLGIEAGKGLYIKTVERNSPASRAQLQAGYLIAEVEGQATDNPRAFGNLIAGQNKGDRLHLTIVAPRRLGSSYVEYRRAVVELVLR